MRLEQHINVFGCYFPSLSSCETRVPALIPLNQVYISSFQTDISLYSWLFQDLIVRI